MNGPAFEPGADPDEGDQVGCVHGAPCAFLIFAAGSTGFVLAGLTRRESPLGRLRALTLLLSIPAVTATWLIFSHHTPVLACVLAS